VGSPNNLLYKTLAIHLWRIAKHCASWQSNWPPHNWSPWTRP